MKLSSKIVILVLSFVFVVACSKNSPTPVYDPSVVNSCPTGYVDSTSYNGSEVSASGWAADKEDGVSIEKIVVYLDNQIIGNVTSRLERKDVSDVYKNPAWLASGWEFKTTLKVSTGKHILSVVIHDKMGAVTKLNEKELGVD